MHYNNFKCLALLFLLTVFFGCQIQESSIVQSRDDLDQIVKRRVLRVVTLQGSLSYYVSGDEEMGYEYDLARNFADQIDVPMELLIAKDVDEMKAMLTDGRADLIAYRIACSKSSRNYFGFPEKRYTTYPVLVQPAGKTEIKDATGLIGKDVVVQKHSKYWRRLNNLNKELGGGIGVVEAPDSLNLDDIVYQVSKGQLSLSIVDNDIAELYKAHFPNININLQVGLKQEKAWAVRKTSPKLLAALNEWYASIEQSKFYRNLENKYYSQNTHLMKTYEVPVPKGSISPYDAYFKASAEKISWDWRFLAALCYNESRFDPEIVSHVGATGLMQLMPRTAAKYGLNASNITDPKLNIEAGVQYIKNLNMVFRAIEDKEERKKFILAGYNSGPAHVLDAMALADKYGDNPYIWHGSVEKYLLLKKEPKYYNDKVVKYGYFRGNHTVRYVNDVYNTYYRYLGVKKPK